MTTQLPERDSLLDFVVWEDQAVEEDWGLDDLDDESAPALTNVFQITDLQHWLDLCA